MQSKLDQLGKAFIKDKKTYVIDSTAIKMGKAYVYTDRKTFVLYENELDELIASVEVCEVPEELSNKSLPAKPMFLNAAISQQITRQNTLSNRMSTKLEEVFDELSGNPGEETYKKAKSMVEVANSIVNVSMANYKYLTLNN
jgi:hypothetical protein